jgi:spermidine synthase
LRIPLYKRLFSYLVEIPVEEVFSKHSGLLEVSIQRGEWKLSSPNAIYSYGRHYTSYQIAFDSLGINDFPVQRVLILGAGIGSVARLLSGHPTIEDMTVVDIDEVVISLAQKYWPIEEGVAVHFEVADAAAFVAQSTQAGFDMILSDVFIDDETPEQIIQETYLAHLYQRLSPAGILLFSKLDYTAADKAANQAFSKIFQSVFKQGYTIPAAGNLMYVARK